MSVKPSAITGAGTENNPYVIHNYNELKWCCEDADAVPEGQAKTDYVYVKVNNDIDCSTYGKSFRFSIYVNHACDINLNNKTIQNFYILSTSYMFNVVSAAQKLTMHHGKILNIYGDWIWNSAGVLYMGSNADDAILSFTSVSMSIDVTSFSNNHIMCLGSTQKFRMTNCTVDFSGSWDYTSNLSLFTSLQLYTCDIHLNITSKSNVLYIMNGSGSTRSYALNCRFMGQIHLNAITTSSSCMNFATLRNCVIDTAVTSTNPSTASVAFVYSPGSAAQHYGIYNTEKLPNYTFSTGYIACTTADMDMRVNPNADIVLQEKGFDVIKG